MLTRAFQRGQDGEDTKVQKEREKGEDGKAYRVRGGRARETFTLWFKMHQRAENGARESPTLR